MRRRIGPFYATTMVGAATCIPSRQYKADAGCCRSPCALSSNPSHSSVTSPYTLHCPTTPNAVRHPRFPQWISFNYPSRYQRLTRSRFQSLLRHRSVRERISSSLPALRPLIVSLSRAARSEGRGRPAPDRHIPPPASPRTWKTPRYPDSSRHHAARVRSARPLILPRHDRRDLLAMVIHVPAEEL